MTPAQMAADAAWMVALVICLAVAIACAVAIAAVITWQTRHLYVLLVDRLEVARIRHTARRYAARAPFDGLRQQAADDDRSHTANAALDEPRVDTAPGTDHKALIDLNALYRAPSWKEEQ